MRPTGGAVTTDGLYTVHLFTGDGTFSTNRPAPQVICDGNSMTLGHPWEEVWSLDPTAPYPTQLWALLGSAWLVRNLGVDSQDIDHMIADAATEIDPLFDANLPHNIVVCWEGTNEIYYHDDGASAATKIAAYCAARRAAGFRVIVLTVLPRAGGGTPADFEAQRSICNAAIRSDWATYADALADVAADSRIGDSGDESGAYYTADAVHLTKAGYGIVASIVNDAVSSIAATRGLSVERLVVGGGGAGATGGGGAGEYVFGTAIVAGDIAVTVGAGGTGTTVGTIGESGDDSSFGTVTAKGGGGGGRIAQSDGAVGGSGGGGGQSATVITLGGISNASAGVGNQGGSNGTTAYPYPAGGGGGAGGAGGVPPNADNGGAGGAGVDNDIVQTGTDVGYAGGGGGGDCVVGTGGPATHGGGAGSVSATPGVAATANTGGGGGGGGNGGSGGSGGSGIVVVRYLTADGLNPSRAQVATEVDDTLWQILAGSDAGGWRDVTDECGNLVYSTVMPGGPASASFSLPADVWGLGYNEVRADQKLIVRYAGRTPWSGIILPRGVNYQGE